jgi:hypothetical protein
MKMITSTFNQRMGSPLMPPPGGEPEQVGICDITINPAFQVRDRQDEGLVHSYLGSYNAGADMPPIRLARFNDSLILFEGFHRIAAQQLMGREIVWARIQDATSVPEIIMWAYMLNSIHGKGLTNTAKQRCLAAFLKDGRHIRPDGRVMTYQQIAIELHGTISKSNVFRWIRDYHPEIASKIATSATESRPFTRTNNDNTEMKEQHTMDCVTARAGINLAITGLGKLNPTGAGSSTVRALQIFAERELRDCLTMIDDVERERFDEAHAPLGPDEDF